MSPYQRIDYHRRIAIHQHVPMPKPPPLSYSGPGDVVSGAMAWWGLRAYSDAVRGSNCCRIRRASDNAEQDFTTLAYDGTLDRASIVTFLTSTSGFFVTFYDQTGNSRPVTQATAANQAPVNLSGLGSLTTADFTASSSHRYSSSATITRARPFIWVAAAKSINTGTQQCIFFTSDSQTQLGYRNSADNQVFLYGGDLIAATASDGSFHVIQALSNGSSPASLVNIDGSSTTGTMNTSGPSGATISLGHAAGSQHLNGSFCEGGLWPSAFDSTQLTAMDSNIGTFWSI